MYSANSQPQELRRSSRLAAAAAAREEAAERLRLEQAKAPQTANKAKRKSKSSQPRAKSKPEDGQLEVRIKLEPDLEGTIKLEPEEDESIRPEVKTATKPRKAKLKSERLRLEPDSDTDMEDTAEEASPKRRRTIKEQKVVARNVKSPLPAAKRTRKPTTPKVSMATKKQMGDLKEILTQTVFNPKDPCQVLPTELWHQILSLLPLCNVAPLPMVSKMWLYSTRSFPAWKAICERAKLGEPKLKYRSYMALACSRSHFICDKCYSHTTGRPRSSMIPLPVANKDDNETVWMLCRDCRLEYYGRYPEQLPQIYRARITRTSALSMYHMMDCDLRGLFFQEAPNPHSDYATPMRLYRRDEIINRALTTHGGWVGVYSFPRKVLRRRKAACNRREAGFKKIIVRRPKVVEGQKLQHPVLTKKAGRLR
ncbi:hypothetical protein B0O80DRAFT_532907 [Mortierella sp. GBAus27b]|nr:hypothetical protein BGX31_006782 [Mortierella sp. GBA43]KAI8347525.1 hypothetical protein B0O80DRAFT_532907 [Mortierella sp. GBAus27b]